ncbi:MAG: penicillin-binding protein 1C [Kiritimatiellia bacterium]|jgi:penicillin-binding protein 1C
MTRTQHIVAVARRWVPRALIGLMASTVLGAAALVSSFYAVPLPERLAESDSTVIAWRDGSPAHVFLSSDDRWRVAVDINDIDSDYINALIRLEDKRFYQHAGVDPMAVARAAHLNLMRGRVVSGGSTLTMQVVRVLEPRPRNLSSKVIEAWRALQLEWFLSKDEVLVAYATYVPFGRNVEGVEAASWAYFGHSARQLSGAELSTLLAVPQAPSARYPTAAHADRLTLARDEIAAYLAQEGALPVGDGDSLVSDEQALQIITDTPVPTTLERFPRDIPHLAYWLRQRHLGDNHLVTTLDRGTQQTTERNLYRHRVQLANNGIHHGSAIVMDHKTGHVLALVGNQRFWSDGSGDQVPMFNVPRSPGSTLKPFIYASAIDKGQALPEHLVRDIPVSYHGYAPRNYDGRYEGLVQLEDALSRSLNLPFIFLLKGIGVDDFLGQLRIMGVQSLRPEPGYYGLSVAAGGVELTPLEVTGLFATLANDGGSLPVRLLDPKAETPEPIQVYSPGAAWLTRRALKKRDRPDFPDRRALATVPVGIHWKTGTSFGHRDAWACGSGPEHTACVWLGNADHSPSRHLVGAEAAGPPLFDILEGVGPRAGIWADPRPHDLVAIEVDAWSGRLPTAASPSTKEVWALRHKVPTAKDTLHVLLDIDVATGLAVNAACTGDRVTEEQTFVVFPAAVRRWLGDQHRRLPEPPKYAPGCAPAGVHKAPVLLSPVAGQIRVLIPGMSASRQEIPLEADSQNSRTLSWFVDGVFLGTHPAEKRVWWEPSAGEHEVTVRDDAGLTATRRFLVQESARMVGR